MGFCLQFLFVQILDFGFRILDFVPRFGAYVREVLLGTPTRVGGCGDSRCGMIREIMPNHS